MTVTVERCVDVVVVLGNVAGVVVLVVDVSVVASSTCEHCCLFCLHKHLESEGPSQSKQFVSKSSVCKILRNMAVSTRNNRQQNVPWLVSAERWYRCKVDGATEVVLLQLQLTQIGHSLESLDWHCALQLVFR